MNTLTKEQKTKEQQKDIRKEGRKEGRKDNDCVYRAAALQTEDWSRVGSEYR